MVKSKDSSTIAAGIFDDLGEDYSKAWGSVAKKLLDQKEKEVIGKALGTLLSSKKKIKVLEVGIGIGRIADYILSYSDNIDYFGVDISEEMVSLCRKKFSKKKSVNVIKSHDISKGLPTDLGKFDLIVGIRVLSYSPSWKENIEQSFSMLNKGGKIVFSMPNSVSLTYLPILLKDVPNTTFMATYNELTQVLADAGFKDLAIIGFTRLIDTLYDLANDSFSSRLIFAIEDNLGMFLGDKLFVKNFYFTGTKC